MRPSTKRILSIGAAFFLLIGALVIYQNLIQPIGKVINEKRAEVDSKENLFRKQSKAVHQVQDLINRFKNMANLEEVVSLALPNRSEITQALSQLEAVARVSNVVLSALEVKNPIVQRSRAILIKDLGVITVVVNVGGSYENLKAFLRALETNVRVANIQEITFKPAAPQGNFYLMNLTVEFYYQNI